MRKFLLVLILILAAALRLVALTSFPSGFNADEAALGYNAYSLLLTGKDEHGHPWPVNLESFGDYKPALYAYLLIPFIKVMGLTELAVRLPSALLGILSVALIYALAKLLVPKAKYFPHLAALGLAISPWAIHFSRGGWEVNLATTLLLAGCWLFVTWTRSLRVWHLSSAFICFVLTLYAYQSTRVVSPLLVIGLLIIYRRLVFSHFRRFVISCLLPVLLLVPLVISLTGVGVASRFSGVGLTADIGPVNRINQFRGQHSARTQLLAKILYNRPVVYTLKFISNYFDHFSPVFLFISGDEVARNRVPETGVLYLTDFIFLALGAVYLWRRPGPHTRLIWLWLGVAPVASALTFQTPSALRAFPLVIPLVLLIALGVNYLLDLIRSKKLLVFSSIILIIIYGYQFTRYLHEYYINYPAAYPAAWEYGFSQLVPYVQSVQSKYQRVLVTDKYDQPYILFLFFSRYPPQDFQNHHVLTFRDQFNFSTVRDYGKFHFASTPWDQVRDIHSALIVAAPEDIPSVGVNIVKTIYFPNGDPAFKIISN